MVKVLAVAGAVYVALGSIVGVMLRHLRRRYY